VKLFNIRE